jgi:hypothetical protein
MHATEFFPLNNRVKRKIKRADKSGILPHVNFFFRKDTANNREQEQHLVVDFGAMQPIVIKRTKKS